MTLFWKRFTKFFKRLPYFWKCLPYFGEGSGARCGGGECGVGGEGSGVYSRRGRSCAAEWACRAGPTGYRSPDSASWRPQSRGTAASWQTHTHTAWEQHWRGRQWHGRRWHCRQWHGLWWHGRWWHGQRWRRVGHSLELLCDRRDLLNAILVRGEITLKRLVLLLHGLQRRTDTLSRGGRGRTYGRTRSVQGGRRRADGYAR